MPPPRRFNLIFYCYSISLSIFSSRQNNLFLSQFQEQVVLRHHNEAESLNAVQKCDWHELACEMKGVNADDVPIQIDDLYIPMVHVSDDFDLNDSR